MSNRPYAQSHKVVGVETVPASVVLNSFIGAAAGDSGRAVRAARHRVPHPPRRAPDAGRAAGDGAGQGPSRQPDQARGGRRRRQRRRVADPHHRHRGAGAGRRGHPDGGRGRHPGPLPGVLDLGRRSTTSSGAWAWTATRSPGRCRSCSAATTSRSPRSRSTTPEAAPVQLDGGRRRGAHRQRRTGDDRGLHGAADLLAPGVAVLLRRAAGRASPCTPRMTLVPRTPSTWSWPTSSGEVVCEARGLRYVKVQDIGSGAVGPRDLVHELAWERVTVRPDAPAPRQALLVGLPDGGPALVEALAAQGVEARAATDAAAIGDGRLAAGDVVIVAPPALLPGEAPERAARRCTAALVDAVQRIAGIPDEQRRPTVWVLTRGVREGDSEAALAHAPLWGAGRIVAGERPDLWGGTIDIGGDGEPAEVAGVIGALPPNEDVLSYTADGLFAARLQRVERPAERESVECRPDGTYLVTGGLGALGLEAARYLVEQGARRLVLVGRRGLPPRVGVGPGQRPGGGRAGGRGGRPGGGRCHGAGAAAGHLRRRGDGPGPRPGRAGHAARARHRALRRRGVRRAGGEDRRGEPGHHHGAEGRRRDGPAPAVPGRARWTSSPCSPPCGQFARLTGQVSYASANSFLDALAALRRAQGETGATSFAWAQWIGRGMGETTGKATILEAESRGPGRDHRHRGAAQLELRGPVRPAVHRGDAGDAGPHAAGVLAPVGDRRRCAECRRRCGGLVRRAGGGAGGEGPRRDAPAGGGRAQPRAGGHRDRPAAAGARGRLGAHRGAAGAAAPLLRRWTCRRRSCGATRRSVPLPGSSPANWAATRRSRPRPGPLRRPERLRLTADRA